MPQLFTDILAYKNICLYVTHKLQMCVIHNCQQMYMYKLGSNI